MNSSEQSLATARIAKTPWRPSLPKGTAFRRGLTSVLAVFILWEVVGRLVLTDRLTFVPLSSVLAAFVEQWTAGTLQEHLLVSLQELGLGFVAAAIGGLGIGLLLATSNRLLEYADIWISILYTMPMVALAPVIVLWLGIGIWSKVAVVFLVSIFPIIINTISGIRSADALHMEVARAFGASRRDIYKKVLFPSAIAPIIAGMRLGVGRAIIGVVVAEMIAARAGLGYLILTSAQVFNTATLFMAVFLLALFGVVTMSSLKWLEKSLTPWRHFSLEEEE